MSRSLRRSLLVVGIAAASTVTLSVLPASAVPVGFTVDQETGQLASIDTGTSVVTDIGGDDGGIDSLALACDGTLFGIESLDDGAPSDRLVTIDTATGATTPIGALGLHEGQYGMAFAPDGRLWLSSQDQLFQADVTTGTTTLVGSLLDAEADMNSLAFDADGTLYGYDDTSSRLYTIDLATAAATEVGAADYGMGDVLGLDFDGEGTLWAIARTDGTGTATFDVTTGEGSFTDGGQIGVQGLALTALPCSTPETTTSTSTSTSTTTTAPAATTTPPGPAAPAPSAAVAVAGRPTYTG